VTATGKEQQSELLVKMERQTFTWGYAGNRIRKSERWVERLWVLGLLLAALLLFGINLGSLPLQDAGEGRVALVAREIGRATMESWQWLYPKFAGKPYLEEPPLLHWLIAGAYKIGGANEWTTRLPGAILSALSVPLLYGIGREIFPSRQSAIFSALIYLTFLPVACQGRLAMVDGTALCFVMLMMWCVLRSRRDLRWALGAGLGLGLICLTKGILLGVLLSAIALLFLGWDTPRLLTSVYWWLGLLLGSAPGVTWYTAGLLQYGQTFITTGIVPQSLQGLWAPVEGHSRSPWYYLLEILKFATPWLLFWPYGFRLAWENRNWGWAKLVLVWAGVYLLAILVMSSKLPWYVLPLYPTLALAGGAQLAEVWNWPSRKFYPPVWSIGLSLIALGAIALSVYFGILTAFDRSLSVLFASVALTMTMAAVLVARRDLQFLLILFWGMYISMLLFMTSPYWSGQLKEAFPVKDVAAILKHGTPENQLIYASFPSLRPSLDFYSDRQVIPASHSQLKHHWEQDKHPYLLLDTTTDKLLNLKSTKTVGRYPGWVLITKPLSNK
jgi:4-amino-4-deoxy-L-arabinose transferase-like glycosyltransferase